MALLLSQGLSLLPARSVDLAFQPLTGHHRIVPNIAKTVPASKNMPTLKIEIKDSDLRWKTVSTYKLSTFKHIGFDILSFLFLSTLHFG